MWKFDRDKGELKGKAEDFATLVMAMKGLEEEVRALKTRLSEFESQPFAKLAPRMEALEREMDEFRGDWMTAKGTLSSLYGRITKREALGKPAEERAAGEFQTADDVLAYARAKGYSR